MKGMKDVVEAMTDETAIKEKMLAERIQAAGRRCGQCSLCCRLLDVPEVKPAHDWCPHCRPGRGGCSIYDQRPNRCRTYACLWLLCPDVFGDEWFPAKSKIVVDFHDSEDNGTVARFHIDPRFPNRWREEPYYSTIKRFSLGGLRGDFKGHHFKTIVSINGKWTIVLPNKEVPYGLGIVMPMGGDRFEFVRCNTGDDVKKLDGALTLLSDANRLARIKHLDSNPIELTEYVARDPRIIAEIKKNIATSNAASLQSTNSNHQ